MTAAEILATHRITIKTNRRRNGIVNQYFSIQFTYLRKRRQFTGATREEVRQKVEQFFAALRLADV